MCSNENINDCSVNKKMTADIRSKTRLTNVPKKKTRLTKLSQTKCDSEYEVPLTFTLVITKILVTF